MTERQLFSAIGEVDAAMVAAAVPFTQRKPRYGWMLAAAAAVVVGVIGYAGLMNAWEAPPPVEPAVSATVLTTTTTETQKTTSVPPFTGTTVPYVLKMLGTQADGAEETTVRYGGSEVFAFTFEELQMPRITEVPTVLPVYEIQYEALDEDAEQKALVAQYAALLGDTLSEPPASAPITTDGWGEMFRYSVPMDSLTYRNVLYLSPQDTVYLGETSEWLDRVTALYPALFADMQEPTLYLSRGQRYWYSDENGKAAAEKTVSFDAHIYDAANDPDGTAKWMSGIELTVEDGELKTITVYLEDACETVGYYPVFALEEAYEMVEAEIARRKADGTADDDCTVLGVELVYNTNSVSRLRAPCYRFLITAGEKTATERLRRETGMTSFEEIVFCAVPSEYWTPETDDLLTTQR